jgi:alkylation response protein AidB-like acyl-CoA dehydrogenase
MTLAVDTEQTLELIARSAAEFARPDAQRARHVRDTFAGHDPATWGSMAEQGWLASLLPEEQGGTGLGIRAASVIAERLGYACHTEPFVAVAVVAVRCLMLCPESSMRDELLRMITGGAQIATVAWQPPGGELTIEALQVVAEPVSDGVSLRGTTRFVVAPQADLFIVAAWRQGKLALYSVPSSTSGLTVTREKMADGTLTGWLRFDGTRVPAAALLANETDAEAALGAAIDAGVLCTAAELLGSIERSLEITLAYLGTRQQFGQVIGTFQVLQHRAVDMWIYQELTRAALRSALDVFDEGAASSRECRAAASSVKSRASQTALHVAGQSVQLHGAIGITDEYELGVYINRSLVLAAHLGNAAAHRRRYGELVDVQEREGAAGPDAATERQASEREGERDQDWNTMSDERFRQTVRAEFEANYPARLRYPTHRLRWSALREWYLRMAAKGWIAPAWPRAFGGMGLSPAKLLIFLEEQERWGIARYQDHGVLMLGPLLLRYGTNAQRERFLPPILRCEHIWCQGYSEPDAGSDLASLRTRAQRVDGPNGPEFVISGQKTWTTLAQDATHIFVLVRTDQQAKKQKGISFLLVDVATPGIRVRPIRDIAGHEEFCEVFFDNVRVPAENLVGELNEGWTVAKSLLGFERVSLGSPKFCEYGLQVLLRIARLAGLRADPVFREKFIALQLDVAHLSDAYAVFANTLIRGDPLGHDVSLLKIWSTETFQRIAELTIETAGACGALTGEIELGEGNAKTLDGWYKARSTTIYGGSNEIQRNIIARHVLRLPNC